MPELQNIEGVEVFAVGEWNGDKYTEKDLDIMVKAFNETSKSWRPPLKLGHDANQTILQQDGLPAAGWISNLRRIGQKLVADLVDIPKKVFEVIKNKAYDTVSAEIHWNAEVDGNPYKRVLSAVALLGADLPAVTNLQRISDRFSFKGETRYYTLKLNQNSNNKGAEMPEENKEKMEKALENEQGTVEALKAQVASLKAECEKLKKALEKKNEKEEEMKEAEAKKENTEHVAEVKKLSEDNEALRKQIKEKDIEASVASLLSEQLITKAMKPYVKELLDDEKKSYSIKIEKEEKEFSKEGLLKEILQLKKAAEVNLDENSEAGKKNAEDEKDLIEKVSAYAKEKGLTFGQATKAMLKKS